MVSFFNVYNIDALTVHNQKRARCSKSAVGFLPCSHQADIRMRLHRLLPFEGRVHVVYTAGKATDVMEFVDFTCLIQTFH